MRIITLGTSHGACEKGQFCSAELLEAGGVLYLIDCGAPVEGLLTNMDVPVSDINAVFVTHMHDDHASGLTSIIKRFATYQKDRSITIYLPEENGITALKAWSAALHQNLSERVTLSHIKPGLFFDDGNIKAYAIPTDHIRGYETYAFMFEGEGKRVLFSGDLTSDLHDLPCVLTETDLDAVVLELTHYKSDEHIDKLAAVRTKQLIFNHRAQWNVNRLNRVLDRIAAKVAVASDLDVFEI